MLGGLPGGFDSGLGPLHPVPAAGGFGGLTSSEVDLPNEPEELEGGVAGGGSPPTGDPNQFPLWLVTGGY